VGKHSYLERGLCIVFLYLDDEMGLAIRLSSSCALFMYVLWQSLRGLGVPYG